MYRLTEKRFQKAKLILEKYRNQLHRTGQIEAGFFERELGQCWNLGYKALKGVMRDLLKEPRYRFLAAYYMEHSNAPGVVMEFQNPLAGVYGISYYHSKDREKKKAAFWAKMSRIK